MSAATKNTAGETAPAPALPTELFALVEEARQNVGAACARTVSAAGKLAELGRAQAGAALESGKVLNGGLNSLSAEAITRTGDVLAAFSADLADLTTLRTPQDALRFQERVARRNAGLLIDQMASSGRALGLFASDLAAPLSARVTANLEALRTLV